MGKVREGGICEWKQVKGLELDQLLLRSWRRRKDATLACASGKLFLVWTYGGARKQEFEISTSPSRKLCQVWNFQRESEVRCAQFDVHKNNENGELRGMLYWSQKILFLSKDYIVN